MKCQKQMWVNKLIKYGDKSTISIVTVITVSSFVFKNSRYINKDGAGKSLWVSCFRMTCKQRHKLPYAENVHLSLEQLAVFLTALEDGWDSVFFQNKGPSSLLPIINVQSVPPLMQPAVCSGAILSSWCHSLASGAPGNGKQNANTGYCYYSE